MVFTNKVLSWQRILNPLESQPRLSRETLLAIPRKMKRYYALDLPAESIETGNNYPQLEFDNVKEAFKFKYSFPETEPELSAKLQKGSKLSDILSQASITGNGLMVSEEVNSIITRYRIMSHKIYSCPVKDHIGVIHQYYWIAFVQPELVDMIDYEKSTFYLKKGLKDLGEITLTNFNHYKKIKETLDISTIVKLKKVFFKDIELDLFQLPLFDSNIYVSQFLKDSISTCTGFNLTEVEI